jgi:hypothetical protein
MQPVFRQSGTLLAALVLTWIPLVAGCGEAPSNSVDTGPFERAVEQYLEEHNMALAIKAVKEGPSVDGNTATMTTSLTHAELGGASVTWEFQFEKNTDGTWKATGHSD